MKLYIKGQQFESYSAGNLALYINAVNPETKQSVATVAKDYYLNVYNLGGKYEGYDIDNLLSYETIDLYAGFGSSDNRVKLATGVPASRLFNDIQQLYNSGETTGTVYVNGYIDIIANSNCSVNSETYEIAANGEWSIEVKSDDSWTITTEDTTPSITASTGTQTVTFSNSKPTGTITFKTSLTTVTAKFTYSDWQVSISNEFPEISGNTVDSVTVEIIGSVDGTVTYQLSGYDSWLGLVDNLTNESTSTECNITGRLGAVPQLNETSESRETSVILDVLVNGSVALTETITYTQLPKIDITTEPNSFNLNYTAQTQQITATASREPRRFLITTPRWITHSDSVTNNTLTSSLSVSENTGSTRTGNITILADGYSKIISVSQAENVPASLTIEPDYASVSYQAGSYPITVTYTGTGNLIATPSATWLSYSDNRVTYEANSSVASRTGSISFSDGNLTEIFTLQQQGKTEASITVSPSEKKVDYKAGSFSATVTYSGTTKPTYSADEWITVTESGTGYVINYSENTGNARTGNVRFSITGASTSLLVMQAAADYINIEQQEFDISSASGQYSTGFTTNISVLSVTSNQPWLTAGITDKITFSVTENTNTASRTGIITVTGNDITKLITVTQAGKATGTLSVRVSSQQISAEGGELDNDIITTGTPGTITIKSSASWCTVSLNRLAILATVQKNTGSARVCTVTVSATNANPVQYTISQSGATEKYIYFETESKSIDYQGGTITNKLYTNGTGTQYSSSQSWATVSSSGTVSISSNSSSTSRSVVITATNSSGTASYTIYQTGYTTDKPIWQDAIYRESADFLEYHIDSGGQTLYAGKAYREPNSNYITLNISDICSNYLTVMPFAESSTGNWRKSFNLVTSTGYSTAYTFYNDWSYGEPSTPVTHMLDCKSPFVVSGPNVYFTVNGETYTVNGSYMLNIENLCGSQIKVYKNNALYWTYQICDPLSDYTIYWANRYGGWDLLPITGNATRTDQITPYKMNKSGYDTKYLSVVKPSWKLNTGWLKGNLADLIASIDVRLYDNKQKKFYKVIITDNSAQYKTYKNSGGHLVKYEINCEMSNDYLRK